MIFNLHNVIVVIIALAIYFVSRRIIYEIKFSRLKKYGAELTHVEFMEQNDEANFKARMVAFLVASGILILLISSQLE